MSRRALNRYAIPGAVSACLILAAAVPLLGAVPVPAATALAGRHVAQPSDYLAEPLSDYDLAQGQAHRPEPNGQDGLDPRGHVPLVLKDYYRLPPWSGTARFGFGVDKDPVEQYSVSLLDATWYNNFTFRSDPPPLTDLEYVQVIRLSETGYSPSQEEIEKYALAQPGTLWLIGNEPDAPVQDCVTPEAYAPLYHELYGIIKGADPSAKVAVAGVVQATPLRLQYLDKILQEYQTRYGEKIPVDVWNVHGFILLEDRHSWGCQIPCGIDDVDKGMQYAIDDHDNMTIFHQQILDFRRWMKDHDERNKPLIVSEYGIILPADYGFDAPRVESFMLATFDYFLNTKISGLGYPADDNRLVQAWSWYSLNDNNFEGFNTKSNLFDPDSKQMTALGRAYRNYTSSLP